MREVVGVAVLLVSSVVLTWVGFDALSAARRARTFGPYSRSERRAIAFKAAILVVGGLAGFAIAVAILRTSAGSR